MGDALRENKFLHFVLAALLNKRNYKHLIKLTKFN